MLQCHVLFERQKTPTNALPVQENVPPERPLSHYDRNIESLRQKHRGMKVLNNFNHVETRKPVLNSFDCEKKNYSSQ